MLTTALIGAAFTIGDGAGWVELLSGHKPTKEWVFAGVFIIFTIIVMIRLVQLQTQIDKRQMRLSLDDFIGEGSHILARLTGDNWDAIDRYDLLMNEWATKIRKLIRKEGYENDWMSNSGLVNEENQDEEGLTAEAKHLMISRNYMRNRIIRLREIKAKLGD